MFTWQKMEGEQATIGLVDIVLVEIFMRRSAIRLSKIKNRAAGSIGMPIFIGNQKRGYI